MNEFNNIDAQIRTIHTQLLNAKNITSTILLSLKTCNKNLYVICNHYISLLSSKDIILPKEWRYKSIILFKQLSKSEIQMEKAIQFFTISEGQLRKLLTHFNEEYF